MCRVRVAKVQKEYDTYAQDKADLLDSEKKGLEQRLAVERAEKVAEMNIRIEKMWQARIKRELDVRHELCAALWGCRRSCLGCVVVAPGGWHDSCAPMVRWVLVTHSCDETSGRASLCTRERSRAFARTRS